MIKAWLSILFFLTTLASMAQGEVRHPVFQYKTSDSIITSISPRYKASFVHRLVMGKNYRKTWSTSVKLPVFHLSSSGFTVVKLGGGQQTKSLRLKDVQGREWVLRTIDKDVKGAIPKSLHNTIGERVVQDMISASHPFSQVVTGQLSRAAKITAPMPEIYFVADDEQLGEYRSIFANCVCMLEERTPLASNSETAHTDEVLAKIKMENDHLVLQKKVLRTRLLDMLVGDWDRHEDQWLWAEKDSENVKLYYAIPRDRDNALFYSNGLLPKLAQVFMPHLSGFKKNSTGLKKLNAKSWVFDQTFLNELDAQTWRETILEFQKLVSDSAIEASVKAMPAPAYALDGAELTVKLKSRRDGLIKNAMDYYEQLAATVTINGSDEEEVFVASGKGEQLQVTVYRLQKDQSRQKIYERTFDPSDTRQILMKGFKGGDHFIVDESAKAKIRLKMFGDEGKDIYSVKGSIKTRIMDVQPEDHVTAKSSSAKIHFADPAGR